MKRVNTFLIRGGQTPGGLVLTHDEWGRCFLVAKHSHRRRWWWSALFLPVTQDESRCPLGRISPPLRGPENQTMFKCHITLPWIARVLNFGSPAAVYVALSLTDFTQQRGPSKHDRIAALYSPSLSLFLSLLRPAPLFGFLFSLYPLKRRPLKESAVN